MSIMRILNPMVWGLAVALLLGLEGITLSQPGIAASDRLHLSTLEPPPLGATFKNQDQLEPPEGGHKR